ncbi:MAG: hypothetical protein ABI995_08950, partial [Acidobacteriota bacterium]
MRNRLIMASMAAASGALFLALTAPSSAQQGQQKGPEGGVNVGPNGGAPQGKGGGKGKAKARPPAAATPHWPDGRVNLGSNPGEKGMWEGNAGATLATNPPGGLDNPSMYLPTNIKIEDVPWQPWAKAIYNNRQAETTKDDPHVRCKPSGGSRMFHTPYGTEFIDVPEEKRMYVMGVGGPHTWRIVYMDGRQHPKAFDPSFSGHSTGKWDGDTLVIDTVGFNEK